MTLLLTPNLFALGLAVGVLGLVMALSLIVAYAYEERTLLLLATYLALMVAGMVLVDRLQAPGEALQQFKVRDALLVMGPGLAGAFLMWLVRGRRVGNLDRTVTAVVTLVTLALLALKAAAAWGGSGAFLTADALTLAEQVVGWVWAAMVLAAASWRLVQSRDSAGPWRWWVMLGLLGGLVVSIFVLSGQLGAQSRFVAYWPVVLMLLLQAPPTYLALVWRSRLINEIRLRSAAANVADPLTGLATSTVLLERLMRITSRGKAGVGRSVPNTALFLIEVKNWGGLLSVLGQDWNEKLLLEAALRLRRSVGDNDLVARIGGGNSGGRFAVVAQGLANPTDVTTLATRLVVSGLRIDSPLLPGVELQFRVIVRSLVVSRAWTLPLATAWLDALAAYFEAWPVSHRNRSFLVVEGELDAKAQQDGGKPVETRQWRAT